MPRLTQPTFGPRTALVYVTVGALIGVWTIVWYFTRDYELTRSQLFWVIGLALTGLTFVALGLLLGPLERSARRAELPPPEVIQAEAAIQQAAAANTAVPVVPVTAAPVATPPVAANPAPPAPPGTAVEPRTA